MITALQFSPNVKVFNNSWHHGDPPVYSIIYRNTFAAIYKQNRVSCVAMGNTSSTLINYPVGFNTGLIAVGATDNNDVVAGFSTRGPHIDVSAPGVGITSSSQDDQGNLPLHNGTWRTSNGTSYSTPMVAGLASLLMGYNPGLANDDVENIIKLSADDIDAVGFDNNTGYGRINMYKALNSIVANNLYQWNATGGTVFAVEPMASKQFLGASGITDGSYPASRIEVRKTVTFPKTMCVLTGGWGRGVNTTGYREEINVCYGEGICEVVPGTLTSTSVTLKTYIYQIGSAYYPQPPANVTFQYSILGIANSDNKSKWNGGGTSDWNTASNWSCGIVPNSSTADVYIVAGASPLPVLSTNVTVRNLSISGTSNVNLNSKTLTMYGSFNGSGSLKGSAASGLTINGNAGSLRFTTGFNVLKDLLLNTGGTAAIATPLDITAGSSPGSVIVNSGATLNVQGNLTIKSNALGTARVGISTGTITGDVTVERYISQTTNRAYRLLSLPTTGQTIRQSWQENQAAGINGNPGYGTNISSSVANWAAQGFDFNSSNNLYSNIDPATGSPIGAVTSTANPIATRNGYYLLVNGDRTCTPLNSTITATTLRTKGVLYQGTQPPVSVNSGEFGLIGNVYASDIDFLNLTKPATIQNVLYLYDPKLGSAGAMQTFSSVLGWAPTPGGGSYGTASNTIIRSGQAFFVHTFGGSGTITFTENAKTVGSNIMVFRPVSSNKIRLETNLKNDSPSSIDTLFDGNVVLFDSTYSSTMEVMNISKAKNANENISLLKNGKELALEIRPMPTTTDTIILKTSNLRRRSYRLEFNPFSLQDRNVNAFLQDRYTQVKTPISLNTLSSVLFTVDENTASLATERFIIVFTKSPFLRPVTVNNNPPANINVSPNPIVGGRITLAFNTLPLGEYSFKIINAIGNVVYSTNVLNKNNGNVFVQLPTNIKKGTCKLNVNNHDKSYTQIVIIL